MRTIARGSVRRASDHLLAWIDDHDVARPLGVIAFLLVCAGTFVAITLFAGRGERAAPPAPPLAGPSTAPIEFVNRAGGYGLTIPADWEIRREGRSTRIASPNGRIHATFSLGRSGGLEEASARLLESWLETQAHHTLIGSAWERIGGLRSLLVSGTADDGVGRPIRFLVITVRGQPRNYAITITVPMASDAARVLPRLEQIVTSFVIVPPIAETIA